MRKFTCLGVIRELHKIIPKQFTIFVQEWNQLTAYSTLEGRLKGQAAIKDNCRKFRISIETFSVEKSTLEATRKEFLEICKEQKLIAQTYPIEIGD